jgi:hypothetical protein
MKEKHEHGRVSQTSSGTSSTRKTVNGKRWGNDAPDKAGSGSFVGG